MKKIIPKLWVILMVIPFLFGTTLFGATTSQGQLTLKTIQCGSEERSYYEYIPVGYRPTRPVPLVIMLHGAGGNGLLIDQQTHWSTLAEQNNFIVIFPNGHQWWDAYNWSDSNNDEQLIMAVIDKATDEYKIDKKRIYLTGYSSGASMVLTFAFQHAEKLAAIAVASPCWMQGDPMYNMDPYQITPPEKSMPIYIWRGALESWPGPDENNLMIKYWVDFNQTQKEPQTTTRGIYTTSIYRGHKVEVRYTEIANRTHFYSYDPETAAITWNDFLVYHKRENK